jgi:hypothetical protein
MPKISHIKCKRGSRGSCKNLYSKSRKRCPNGFKKNKKGNCKRSLRYVRPLKRLQINYPEFHSISKPFNLQSSVEIPNRVNILPSPFIAPIPIVTAQKPSPINAPSPIVTAPKPSPIPIIAPSPIVTAQKPSPIIAPSPIVTAPKPSPIVTAPKPSTIIAPQIPIIAPPSPIIAPPSPIVAPPSPIVAPPSPIVAPSPSLLVANDEKNDQIYDDEVYVAKNPDELSFPVHIETDNEIHNMQNWFFSLDYTVQLDITMACRLYAWHFDRFLNGIYRNNINSKLIKEKFDKKRKYDWVTFRHDSFKDNGICNKDELTGLNPYDNINTYNEFKDLIYRKCLFIHNVFTTQSYTLQNIIVLYRGVILPKGEVLRPELIGITSMSYNVESAENFAFNTDTGDIYDERKFDSYVYCLIIPKGIKVIPMNICTIGNESEISIIDQGKIVHSQENKQRIQFWHDFIDLNGNRIKANQGVVEYTFIGAIFEPTGLPTFNKSEIAQKIESLGKQKRTFKIK